MLDLPTRYQKDIQRAVEILKSAGCSRVYLFGSLVNGKPRNSSDVDLAVKGCPKGSFFGLLGKLILELDHPVDLVDLDSEDPFARRLEQKGELIDVS